MPVTELTVPIAGTQEGAGATPAASQAATEALTAKADSKPEAKPDATTQAAAKPGDSKDPTAGQSVPYPRFKQEVTQRQEAQEKLGKLEAKGIYDEETAEQILSQVEEYRDLTRIMREDSVAFVTKWSQEAPEGYSHFATALEQRGVQNFLQEQARSYRAAGSSAEADFLDGLLKDAAVKRTQSATAQPTPRSDDSRLSVRASDFHEDVRADVKGNLGRMIDTLSAESQLSEEDKAELIEIVGIRVAKALDNDPHFMGGLNQFYDPRNGYSREMRTQAVKAYEKRLKVGGLVENEVKKLLGRFATNAANGSAARTKVPNAASGNREAAAGGPPAAGVTSREDRDSMKAAIKADFDSGKIDEVKRNQRMLSLPRAS